MVVVPTYRKRRGLPHGQTRLRIAEIGLGPAMWPPRSNGSPPYHDRSPDTEANQLRQADALSQAISLSWRSSQSANSSHSSAQVRARLATRYRAGGGIAAATFSPRLGPLACASNQRRTIRPDSVKGSDGSRFRFCRRVARMRAA